MHVKHTSPLLHPIVDLERHENFLCHVGENIVVGTVTVISIFSFFCTVIRFPAIMAQSVNDFWIH
jgi:hypothetical protein